MMTKTVSLNRTCARGHTMRYDDVRRRPVCDVCEGAGRKQLAKKGVRARGGESRSGEPRHGESHNGVEAEVPRPTLRLVEPTGEEITGTEEAPAPSTSGRIKTQGLPKPKASGTTEDVIQNDSIGALRAYGYVVHINSVKLKAKHVKCKSCGEDWWERPEYNTSQTPGIPDLAVSSEKWKHRLLPAALWLGSEQKGSTTTLSPEQKALEEGGFTVVSRSRQANLESAAAVDAFFDYVAFLEELKDLCSAPETPETRTRMPELLAKIQAFEPPKKRRNGREIKPLKEPKAKRVRTPKATS
jgi:hypothetical protein